MSELFKQLLQIGGKDVLIETDAWHDLIAEQGKLFRVSPHRLDGLRNNCHMNSSAFFILHRGEVGLGTGYALSKDGLWRRHSWIVDGDGQVVETCPSVGFTHYFGSQLVGRELGKFVMADVYEALNE